MKTICVTVFLLSMVCSVISASESKESASAKSITAVTEVFGDGQKVSAVAVEYTGQIDTGKLSVSDYSVEGKTVKAVYANTSASIKDKGTCGRYVIIELDTSVAPFSGMQAGPQPPSASGSKKPPSGFSGPKLGEKSNKPASGVTLSASVTQTADISGTKGETYPAWLSPKTSTNTVNLVVQDFRQLVFTDPGLPDEPLMYNLFIPENYDPDKKYPLVLFIHDAGAVSNNPTETLTQGNGATVWASSQAQAEHECFVLAPQYNSVIVDDTSRTAPQMDITISLIKELMKKYSIDADRLYNTGQSMGGMISIAMDIKYPDFFAASLLVACQWDPSLVAPMAKKPLWIVVSQGDFKANPGQDAITNELIKHGSTVSKAIWNAEASKTELAEKAADMISKKRDINYTVFKNGSHRYTWQYAYSIEGIRNWLFEQKK